MDNKNHERSLLLDKDLYIFDMDGTIYLGNHVFDFAVRFINDLRQNGKRVLFFKDEIMTSGDVTAEFLLRHREGKTVYLVGTDELVENFSKRGIPLLCGKEKSADIVVTSFDTSLTYEKLDNACRLIRGGAEYLSTHPDFNCPTEDGFIPDSGAIAAFCTASTGKVPTYFGKPYAETVEMICEATGVPKEKMCIFGDRLYTDIALGKRHGVTAILVLSGETTAEDVERAEETDRPDLVYPSLAEVDEIMFG